MSAIRIGFVIHLGIAVVVLYFSGAVQAEDVKQKDFGFSLEFSNDAVEKWIAKYHGVFNEDRWQTGRASTLDHPIDDRVCHQTLTAKVLREICLVSSSGLTVCKNDLQAVYATSYTQSGSKASLTRIQGENCNDAKAGFDAARNAARDSIISEFDGVVDSDLPKLKQDFRNILKAINVVEN